MWWPSRKPDAAAQFQAVLDLEGPDDGFLPPEVEQQIFGNCEGRRWRDLEMTTLLRIRDRCGQLVLLQPNAVQLKYARQRGQRNIVLKARQLGMTTYIAGQYFLRTLIRPGRVTLQVAHTQEAAQQIFRIVHRFVAHLPSKLAEWLRIEKSTVREIVFGRRDSRYIVDTAGNPNAGRGLTIHNLHASEVAQWPGRPEETMAALLAGVAPDGNVDLESTPHGAGGFFYRKWQQAQRGGGLTPHFFPWWLEPAYQVMPAPGEEFAPKDEDEQRLMDREGLGPEALLYRRHLRATFGNLMPQEFAEDAASCFLASGRAVFEVAAVEVRLRKVLKPLRTAQNGAERVWLEPEKARQYIIGADVAEGGAHGDYSAAEVLDAETGLQCAELEAQWPVGQFAKELAGLGRRYNHALLAVERNNQGLTVLYALAGQLGYERLYRHGDEEGKFGWPTTAQTKPQAIGALGRMIAEAPDTIQSARLLEQCRGYCFGENGETRAPAGEHDDLVMAMAIALAVRAGRAGRNWTHQ